MLKKIITVTVVLTLLAGLNFSPAQANDDKLQKILQVLNLPAEINGLQARLDRDQLVYGLPTDIPNNEWKPAPPDILGRDWQTANGIDLSHPGEEPRYLGKAYDWNDFSNDNFPKDAPNEIAPAQRKMIAKPWNRGLAYGDNNKITFSYTWGLVAGVLARYHRAIGFSGDEDSFVLNPALDNFSESIKDYFKVLAEPRPGLAGAVRHWHVRPEGGTWYDTISVYWQIFPDFMVESIDPGAAMVKPGETYTGKVIVKAKPDMSFMDDPANQYLYDVLYGTDIPVIGRDCEVPFSISMTQGAPVTDQVTVLTRFEPQGLEKMSNPYGIDAYKFKVPGNVPEEKLEIPFTWKVPSDYKGRSVYLAAEVNDCKTLPHRGSFLVFYGELTQTNNLKYKEIPLDLPDFYTRLDPHQVEADPGDKLAFNVTYGLKDTASGPWKATLRAFHAVNGTEYPAEVKLSDGTVIAPDQPVEFQPGEEKQATVTVTAQDTDSSVIVKINPTDVTEDADWTDNKDQAQVIIRPQCTDVSVRLGLSDVSVKSGGSLTAYVTVNRGNDGPNRPVPVNVTLTNTFGGRATWTIDLDRGDSRTLEAECKLQGGGEAVFTAEAWPVGVEDCRPGNNRARETALVDAPPNAPPVKDSGIFVRILGSVNTFV